MCSGRAFNHVGVRREYINKRRMKDPHQVSASDKPLITGLFNTLELRRATLLALPHPFTLLYHPRQKNPGCKTLLYFSCQFLDDIGALKFLV